MAQHKIHLLAHECVRGPRDPGIKPRRPFALEDFRQLLEHIAHRKADNTQSIMDDYDYKQSLSGSTYAGSSYPKKHSHFFRIVINVLEIWTWWISFGILQASRDILSLIVSQVLIH